MQKAAVNVIRARLHSKSARRISVTADGPQFKESPMDAVRRAIVGIVVLDGREVLDADAVNASGPIHIGVGREGSMTTAAAPTRPALVTAG